MIQQFPVLNRYTGAVQFAAEIDCAADAPRSVKLGLAARWAYKARANLARALLAGVDLTGANLTRANLARANLTGVDLTGAKIKSFVARATRSDGFEFFGFDTDPGLLVVAGCRTMTLVEYRAHIAREYPNTPKARETADILDFIERRAAP